MKSEELTRADIVKISQSFGGGFRNEASIDAALLAGGRKGIFRRIAYIWRALLSSYSLSEGDRKTALACAFIMFEASGMALWEGQKTRLVHALIRVSKENIPDVGKIGRLVRYAVEGD